LKTAVKPVLQSLPILMDAPPTGKSAGLSVAMGMVLLVMLLGLLIFSAGLDASKFIYVDF
jgi:hypothetical protein